MRVLSVASECFPLVKTGGLADVVGALPQALAGEAIAVTTLLPGYPAVLDALAPGARTILRTDAFFGGQARLLQGRAAGLDLVVLEAPHLYARQGNPYVDADGLDWTDNGLRFAALARVAADIAQGKTGVPRPDVLHVHDWQTALAPAYLRYDAGPRVPSVLTIHNLAFQGLFPAAGIAALRLPPESFAIDGVEFHGSIGFLKAGLQTADAITTVSPTYAHEIMTEAGGMGLAGVLRARASIVTGILNGIDETVWTPATDGALPTRYDAATFMMRVWNKSALQRRLGLEPDPEALLYGVVSRLSVQKGLDLVADALPQIRAQGAQFVLLGSGDAGLEARFAAAAAADPRRVACVTGYDEPLAHQIQAGIDALLVPSRFEPCGLTQLCALRYGAVPVVSRVGGLADTVVDANPMARAAGVATGIQFQPVDADGLSAALSRTAALFADREAWRRVQRNAMRADVSWREPARRYAALYRSLLPAALAPSRAGT